MDTGTDTDTPEGTALKVSVVVATFRIGEDVIDLVHSLDRQTLPKEHFEAIFVDDGSGDETVEVLNRLAASRPWMKIIESENSGWPSRPRNIGMDAAQGEYVAFADHDDEFFPDALRAAHAFAAENASDVLTGKESTTGVVSWGMEQFNRNKAVANDQHDPFPLAPMNPHKLYRRQFLRDHDIRFVEGRRVLYEDNMFNISCYAKAEVISVLSGTPYYHWVRGKTTGTTSFRRDADEFWGSVDRVLRHARDLLDGEKLAEARLYPHRIRIAGYFRPEFAKRNRERVDADLAHIKRIVDEHLPVELDARMSSPLRAKMTLFRAGRIDELRKLAVWDQELVGRSVLVNAEVVDGGHVRITTDTRWRDADDHGPRLKRIDGRWLRQVPDDVAPSLRPDDLDMTDDLAIAKVSVGIYSKELAVTWLLPTVSTKVRAEKQGDFDDVVVRTVCEFDPRSLPDVTDLAAIRWQLNVFTRLADRNQQRRVRSTPGTIALWSSLKAVTVHTDKNGWASLDLTPGATTVDVLSATKSALLTTDPNRPGSVRTVTLTYSDTRVEAGRFEVEIGTMSTNRWLGGLLRATRSTLLARSLARPRKVPLVDEGGFTRATITLDERATGLRVVFFDGRRLRMKNAPAAKRQP